MSNVREQIASKVETINTILRFIEQAKKDDTSFPIDNKFSIEDVEKYLHGMKASYKEAYETLNRLPQN